MLRYTLLEMKRISREPRFVFFTILMPVGFYLLWTSIFNDTKDGASFRIFFMVAMAVFGATSAALAATGARLAEERKNGWLRQLQITPLRPWAVVAGKTFAAMTVTLAPVIAVMLVGAFVGSVSLSGGQWAAMLGLMWLGSLPFAALGVLIGSMANVSVSQPIQILCMFALNIFGGIMVPIQVLPNALKSIAEWTPTYRYAELGWRVVDGQAPSAHGVAVLAGWTIALVAAGAVTYRRAMVKN